MQTKEIGVVITLNRSLIIKTINSSVSGVCKEVVVVVVVMMATSLLFPLYFFDFGYFLCECIFSNFFVYYQGYYGECGRPLAYPLALIRGFDGAYRFYDISLLFEGKF